MGDTNNTSLNTSALVAGMGADFTACVLGLSQPTAEELRKCYDMEISNHLKQMTESVDELKGNLDMFFLIVLAIIIYREYCNVISRIADGAWWRHQMEIFSALLAICSGNSLVTGEFPAQRPVMRSFDVFFDLRLNKGLSKQSWGWWFETPSRSLWRHCFGTTFC